MNGSLYNLFLILAVCVGVVGLIAVAQGIRRFGPPFSKRALMNKSEQRVFRLLCSELPQNWMVMCQVSYGAFLKNKSFKHYMSVNSKRADFVIVNPDLDVAAVVEYQGHGHFGRTAKSRERAINSDRIKRQALKEAVISLFEVPAKLDAKELRQFVQMAATQDQPSDKGDNEWRMRS